MSITPASLLQRLRSPSSSEAWIQFVELYSPLLFYWARQAKLQEADAADMVQDVFAILVRELPNFEYDPVRGFRRWLRTVTVNKWRETMRRKQVDRARSPGELAIEIEAPADADPFWEREHRQIVTRRLLEVMKTDFEPTTWRACWETTVEGRSAVDVGQELNLTAGAVRAAKFRVMSRLRAELAGLLD